MSAIPHHTSADNSLHSTVLVLNTMNPSTKKLTQFVLITAFLFQGLSYARSSGTIQVQITANPAQSFVVCAGGAQGDGTVTLEQEKNRPPGKPASAAVTTQLQTNLQLTPPCLPGQIRQYPYSAKGLIHSNQPFLAIFSQNSKLEKRGRKKHGAATLSHPFPLSTLSDVPYKLLGGSEAYGSNDENPSPKHPYWNQMQASGDIDLTMFSGLQLPKALGNYLPDGTSWQTLLSFLDGNSEPQTKTLWVYMEGDTDALTSIQVSREDMEELVASLQNNSSMNWLRNKLLQNQQQELLYPLEPMQDQLSATEMPLSPPVLELIREWLVEILDKPGIEIDLELEQFRLKGNPEEAVEEVAESLVLASRSVTVLNQATEQDNLEQALPHKPDAETSYEGSDVEKLIHKAPLKGDNKTSESSKSGGASSGAGNDGNAQRNPNAYEWSDEGQTPEKRQQGPGSGAAIVSPSNIHARKELTIRFVGRVNSGKSALANVLIGIDHFPVSANYSEKENDFVLNKDGRTLRIQSLQGHGRRVAASAEKAIGNKQFGTADIVILVIASPLDEKDIEFLKEADRKGVKVIVVRNKMREVEREIEQDQKIQLSIDREKAILDQHEKLNKAFKKDLGEAGFSAEYQEQYNLVFTDAQNDKIKTLFDLNDEIIRKLNSSDQECWSIFTKDIDAIKVILFMVSAECENIEDFSKCLEIISNAFEISEYNLKVIRKKANERFISMHGINDEAEKQLNESLDKLKIATKVSAGLGGLGGIGGGAVLGAFLGSFIPVPVVGSVTGAAVGGVAGLFVGSIGGAALVGLPGAIITTIKDTVNRKRLMDTTDQQPFVKGNAHVDPCHKKALHQYALFCAEAGFREYRKKHIKELPKAVAAPHRLGEPVRVMEQLDNMVGLEEVKAFIYSLKAEIAMCLKREKEGLANADARPAYHMVFKGNPGVGKTDIARLISQILYELGVIREAKAIETNRQGLVGGYVGHTAIKHKG